jgi:hypothetical protein
LAAILAAVVAVALLIDAAKSDPGRASKLRLRRIGLAMHNYAERNVVLPPGTLADVRGKTLHGWEALLLPYVDRAQLYAEINFAEPWDSPENLELFRIPVWAFEDYRNNTREDADGLPVSHFAANELLLRPGRSLRWDEIEGGASNVILAGTIAQDPRGWGTPFNLRDPRLGLNADPKSFGFPYGKDSIILFGDGSVRMVNEKSSPTVLEALGTPSGGEKVDPLP